MTETLLLQIQQSTPYWVALAFFAAYPIVTSIMWIITALIFRLRWESAGPPPRPDAELPFVTVLVPAFNEEAVIARSVAAMLRLGVRAALGAAVPRSAPAGRRRHHLPLRPVVLDLRRQHRVDARR